MNNFTLRPIGHIQSDNEKMAVILLPEYKKALQALDGFSHVNLLWWFSDLDAEEYRSILETPKPGRIRRVSMGK